MPPDRAFGLIPRSQPENSDVRSASARAGPLDTPAIVICMAGVGKWYHPTKDLMYANDADPRLVAPPRSSARRGPPGVRSLHTPDSRSGHCKFAHSTWRNQTATLKGSNTKAQSRRRRTLGIPQAHPGNSPGAPWVTENRRHRSPPCATLIGSNNTALGRRTCILEAEPAEGWCFPLPPSRALR